MSGYARWRSDALPEEINALTTMPAAATTVSESAPDRPAREAAPLAERVLVGLADLRLTVVLFALSIFLVFAGTLAQVDHDVWFVVEEGYFRVWFAWVEFQAFARLVEMFTKAEPQQVAGGFWFPGGRLIGCVMFANLLAAHAIRFKVSAKGARRAVGLGVLAAGLLATIGVIAVGMDQSLKGQLSPEFCGGLWQALRAALAGAAVLGAYWAIQSQNRLRAPEWWLATTLSVSLLAVVGYLFANPSIRPDDAGMRIVWELTKCGGAAVLSLLGCWTVFKQRAGIVLLHAGVGLLMLGELVTDQFAEEGRMSIPEGQTVDFVEDIRRAELAVTTDEGETDLVTVIPGRMLARAAETREVISHEQLPFDLRVQEYFPNASLVRPAADTKNPATAGAGLARVAVPVRTASGVDVDASVDLPAAYVEALDKDSGESLGVWLSSITLLSQPIDSSHGLELRFKRTYKPYSVTLQDFEFKRYVGTEVPKDFSSHVVLSDPERGVELPVRIWMNNPLRYAGDTFYQSGYDPQTETTTILQVVTNGGWMLPYLSCMYVGLGMLWHFGITLARFARRRVEDAKRLAKAVDTPDRPGPSLLSASAWRTPSIVAPAIVGLVVAGYFGGKARPSVHDGAVRRFGALPVAEGGA